MKKVTFKRGDFLIASLSLLDPNFVQSVVLICEHDEEKGTYGLVLNHPVEVPAEVCEALPFSLETLYRGGPVRPEALQVLHPYGDVVPGSVAVLSGLWLGGEFGILSQGLEEGAFALSRCRFFIGYSGWEKDQLARECAQGSWLRVRGNTRIIEKTAPEELWAAAIRLYGRRHPIYRHFSMSPELN